MVGTGFICVSYCIAFYYRSEEETSGDEAEDHDTDDESEEDGDNEDEDKSLEPSKAAQIQKL